MSSRTDLHESWYGGCVLKFVDAFQFRSHSDTTWRSSCFYGYFRYITMVIVVYKAISVPVVSFVAIYPSVNVDCLFTMILLLLWVSWLPGLSLSLVAFFVDYVKAPEAFRYMDVLILIFLGSGFFFPVLTARTFALVTSAFCFWVLLEHKPCHHHCDIPEMGFLTGFLKLLSKFLVQWVKQDKCNVVETPTTWTWISTDWQKTPHLYSLLGNEVLG